MNRLLLMLLTVFFCAAVNAQTRRISGTVVDDVKTPLGGVTVAVKNGNAITQTDSAGKFSIHVPVGDSSQLDFSYVGYLAQTVPAAEGMIVSLVKNIVAGEDLVIIGYGSATSIKDLTGSVSSVSGKMLARVPVASVAEALQGKAAGVQVTMADGQPGAEINIRIRGGSSVTQSNAPLFIVDGFPVDNINDLPPTDILNIDILKDASLTAVYGARGGNGVVVVTTKRAQAGKLSVGFIHNTQTRMLTRKIQMMTPYEYVKLQYDAVVGNNANRQRFRGNFGNPQDFALYKRFEGNDWQDEIMGGMPLSHMYNVTLNGGTQTLKFNTSITHNEENGIIVGTGVSRTNVNTKFSADLSKNVRILVNPRFSYRQDRNGGANNVGTSGLMGVLRYRPINGLRDFSFMPLEDLDPDEERLFEFNSPRGDIDQNYSRVNRYDFVNQASIDWTIIKGLIFRTQGTQQMSFVFNDRFYGDLTGTGISNNRLPVTELSNSRSNVYGWINSLEYMKSVKDHNFTVLVGQEINSRQQLNTFNSSRYFPKSVEPERALRNLGLGTPWRSGSDISSPERMSSYFTRVTYNFDRKYLMSFTYRADGSTKFGPNNRWGYFPAVSAGWVATNEKFLEDQELFSLLKVRASIGKTGNNRITDDMWRYQFGINAAGGPGWGETNETGYEYYVNTGGNTIPNPNVKWETALNRSVALDIGMFRDRLTITPEIYWNTTTDLLYHSNIPTTSGYVRQMQNIGQVSNRGFELTINARIIERSKAYFNSTFTFGYNKKIVDKLNGSETELWLTSPRWSSSENDYLLRVGDQVGLIYGFVYDGIYKFNEFDLQGLNWIAKPGTVNNDALFGTAPGRPKFKNFVDEDGEENIVNDRDRVVIGNTNPKFSGGLNLAGGWGNFDMSANFFYMYGFDVNNATRYQLSSFQDNNNNYYNIIPEFNAGNRWVYAEPTYGDRMLSDARYLQLYQEMNANATIFSPVDIGKRVTHSYFIEDGSFLRLQDLTIGYSLPQRLLGRYKVNNLRVFASGYNLFILTKYRGYDPEVDVQGSLTPGIDFNAYPRSRNFVVGFNITL